MLNQFSRTQLLLGSDALETLANSRVAIFGVGGVGGFVVEALARSGVGFLDLIDNDEVSMTNVNRQIIATTKTMGQKKTTVMKQRILDINPEAQVVEHQCFFLPDNADSFPFDSYDYVVDAVDTVTAKIELAVRCEQMGIPLISSMGTGNKLNPCAFKVADIYQTRVCPLSRIMRKELRRRGVDKLKVVYSEEPPIRPLEDLAIGGGERDTLPPEALEVPGAFEAEHKSTERRDTPGSVAFVPSVAGLIIASEVVKDLISVSLTKAER